MKKEIIEELIEELKMNKQFVKVKKNKAVIFLDLLFILYKERIYKNELFIYLNSKPYKVKSTPQFYIINEINLDSDNIKLSIYEDEWEKII